VFVQAVTVNGELAGDADPITNISGIKQRYDIRHKPGSAVNRRRHAATVLNA